MSDPKEKIDNGENDEEKKREGARIITIQKLADVFCHNYGRALVLCSC